MSKHMENITVTNLTALLKRMVPTRMKQFIRTRLLPKEERTRDSNLGMFILERAGGFSQHVGGQPGALAQVRKFVLNPRGLQEMNAAHQYLQTALMPNFEQDLYEYYRAQQYLILLTFLSYPFRSPGSLADHIAPFVMGSKKMKKMRMLDYGAGLAFGIIHLLRSYPDSVESMTIVELDLIHVSLAEHIISTIAPEKDLKVHRLRDARELPVFGGQRFNFMYGKDVFEHTQQPEQLLRTMLGAAEDTCICYFDFTNHGEKYLQHVSPRLSQLEEIMLEYSFTHTGDLGKMSEFTRHT